MEEFFWILEFRQKFTNSQRDVNFFGGITILRNYLRVNANKNGPKSPINGTSRKIDFACILSIDGS